MGFRKLDLFGGIRELRILTLKRVVDGDVVFVVFWVWDGG